MHKGTDQIRPQHLPPEPPPMWRVQRILVHAWEHLSPTFVIFVLLCIFLFLMFWSRIVYTIPAGSVGVLFERFGGTYIKDNYGEGIQFINPINSLYIYNVRLQEKRETVVVLSNNGLDIRIQVMYRYHPISKETPLLHKEIGPDYEEVVVAPSVISSIREVIGRYRPEEIYTTHTNIIPGEIFDEVRKRMDGKHVFMDAVIVENISLPPQVQSAIASKHVVEQALLEYEFKLAKEEKERQRKAIEAAGVERYNQIIGSSLSKDMLIWNGILATNKLAESPNAKVVIMGAGGKDGNLGLPLILGGQMALDATTPSEKSLAPETTAKDASETAKTGSTVNKTQKAPAEKR